MLEETVSDVNLIEISSSHSDHVLTKKFSRRVEGAASGADWLWCIGEPGSWLILLVQAKIINPKTGNCHYLNYRGGHQCSLLVSYARSLGAVPIYAIYAHIPNGYQPPPKASPHFQSMDSALWGCSWLTPRIVKNLNKNKKKGIEDVLAKALPWSLPFCKAEPESDSRFGHAIAHGFSAAASCLEDSHLVAKPQNQSAISGDGEVKKRIQWDSVDPTEVVNEELFPRSVERVIALGAEGKAPVAGVSVISGQPINTLDDVKALTHDIRGTGFYQPAMPVGSRRRGGS